MKRINPPHVDDVRELQLLANNGRLGSYPDLMNEYLMFRSQYDDYTNHGGDPWYISQLPISVGFRNALIAHYDDPPNGRLGFIKQFRYNLSPTICPMCGGLGNGTLDHYLPKTIYPEFAFFSKNLVPCCNCNSLRGVSVKGASSPARAIHPFFDDFVNQRLYQSVFMGGFDAPRISIEVIDQSHPEIDILQFHLDKVIDNSATQGWFDKYWSDLSCRAHHILKWFLPPNPQSLTSSDLMDSIEKYRDSKDDEYETPNNWFSIFYSGLMRDQDRVERLAQSINASRCP